jgi:tetratricopeptide (TPR) repeat protein
MAGMYAKQYQESQRGFEGYLKRVDYSEISHDIFYSHSNVLVQLGKFDEALRAVDEIIKMNGSDPVPWAQRGWILVTAQRYREAKLSCYRALDLNIEYAEAWHIIGAANRGLGRYQLAIEAYRLAVDMPQENSNIKRSEYWFPLGELYVITGQRDKAEGVLEVLETMDAERAEALRKLIAEMR